MESMEWELEEGVRSGDVRGDERREIERYKVNDGRGR